MSNTRVAAPFLIALMLSSACQPRSNSRSQEPATLSGRVLLVVTNSYTYLQTETGLHAATLEFLDSSSASAAIPTVVRAITDREGHYELPAMPPGTYTLQAVIWDSRLDDPPYLKCTQEIGGGTIADRPVWIYSGERANSIEVHPGKRQQSQIRISLRTECATNYSP